MRAAIYARVSSSTQRREATIETQITVNEEYCRREGLEIVARYLDDGLSGTVEFEARPGGAALLADAAARQFDVVVVYDISRLGRDDHATIAPLVISRLRSLGIQILSPNTRIEDTPEGRLLTGIEANIAAFYRADLTRKTMDGKLRAAREGRWVGGQVPYGYIVVDRKLQIREDQAEIIRRIYHELAGGGSANMIFQQLNAEGITRPEGGPWYQTRIGWLVRQPTYRGEFVTSNRGEIIRQSIPAIVDEETWQRANAQLDANLTHGRKPRHEALLRGMVYCGICGRRYYWDYTTGSRRTAGYYKCPATRPKRLDPIRKDEKCSSRWINGTKLDALAWKEITRILSHPERFLARMARRLEKERRGVSTLITQAEKTRSALAVLTSQVDAILAWHRRGRITELAADRQLQQIQAEERTLKESLVVLEKRIAAADCGEERLRNAEILLLEMKSSVEEADFATRRCIAQALIERITVLPDGTTEFIWRLPG